MPSVLIHLVAYIYHTVPCFMYVLPSKLTQVYDIEDTYGPYKDKKQCITRAYTIAAELPAYMPDYVAVKYKCFKQEDAEGRVRVQWHMRTDEQRY
jgi:hypothetical protein